MKEIGTLDKETAHILADGTNTIDYTVPKRHTLELTDIMVYHGSAGAKTIKIEILNPGGGYVHQRIMNQSVNQATYYNYLEDTTGKLYDRPCFVKQLMVIRLTFYLGVEGVVLTRRIAGRLFRDESKPYNIQGL